VEIPAPENERRLFFALLPEEGERLGIQRTAGAASTGRDGRPVPPGQWHVTLLFLGGVAESRLACIEQAAGCVRQPPFELTLDRLGYWRRSGVLWLGASSSPAALDDLVAALRGAVAPCGIALDDRPFRLHLTLVRGRRRRPPPRSVASPVSWRVSRFALMESLPAGGAGYRTIASWALGGPDAGTGSGAISADRKVGHSPPGGG
jgi:2'-5' RNA ligase